LNFLIRAFSALVGLGRSPPSRWTQARPNQIGCPANIPICPRSPSAPQLALIIIAVFHRQSNRTLAEFK